jgi:hypothetical protein
MRFLARAISVTSLFATAVAAHAAGPRVIITEIMYNPDSEEAKGQTEWVEIANVGDAPIDIKDWRLDDEDKFDWGKFSCTLQPGGVLVLCNADYVREADFRAAWLAAPAGAAGAPDNASADPSSACQVIAVKWGGIANSPGPDNEVIRLLDDKGATVCEVKQEGQWPDCTRPDGSSIYLIDLTASNLSDGRLWKRSDKGVAGARDNVKGEIFNGIDIGSPGLVAGLSLAAGSGPVAANPADSSKPAPPSSQPTTKPGHVIDY